MCTGVPAGCLSFLPRSPSFFLIPRVWAKRWNLLVNVLTTAFAIRSFLMFAGCYRAICPEKKAGLWMMLVSAGVMLVMSLLPDLKVKPGDNTTNT